MAREDCKRPLTYRRFHRGFSRNSSMEDRPSVSVRLTRVEVVVSRLEGQINQLVAEFSGLKERLQELLCTVEDHQNILYGEHGKPGLVSRSETLDELKGAIKGYGREPGISADIKNLLAEVASIKDERKWIYRLILAAIITDVLTRIIGIGK